MEAGRSSYLCGIVLGFALGIAAAHLAFPLREGERLWTSSDLESVRLPDGHGLIAIPPEADAEPNGTGHKADFALADVPAAESSVEPPPAPPRQLPTLASAAPLATRAAKDDGLLKELIHKELDTFAPSDRDVWYETLRDLPHADANSILQIWKAMRPTGPDAQGAAAPQSAAALPTPMSAPAAAPPVADLTPPQADSPPESSSADAIACHEHNLVNASTPGFKRWEPVIVECVGIGAGPTAPRAQTVAMRIDMTRGELHQTNRPFDVAIEGEGFFAVTLDQERYFTRCGRFSLNEARQLGIQTADQRHAILEPAIVVPEGCRKLTILEDGSVIGDIPDFSQPRNLGEIQLSMFLDPTALKPAGSSLYQQTADSGEAWESAPVPLGSRLRQGHCERSNVVPEQEFAAIDRLKGGRNPSVIARRASAAPRTAEAGTNSAER